MSERRLYLDESVGEARGVVTLDGRPERLLIFRDGEPETPRLGARYRARVRDVQPALASAFLELGEAGEAILDFRPDARPVRGALLEVEVRSEARAGKLAAVRAIGPAEGEPGLSAPAPALADQLRAFSPRGEILRGPAARQAADAAEAAALAVLHELPGGGTLAIEPTRALTAVDVDLGARAGQDAKRVARAANLAALGAAARLLRLKGLGGVVVFDLAGRGHDGAALAAAARAAFQPDNPGVAIGPISRFGTLELAVPRRTRPVLDLLCDGQGRLSARTLALSLARRIEDEAAVQAGARLVASCAPEVAEAAADLIPKLADRFGARFRLAPDPRRPREDLEVHAE